MAEKLYLCGAIFVCTIILIVGIISVSLKKLNSDEVGIKYNNFQKKLGSSPNYAGLHPGPPGYFFITFPSVFMTMSFEKLQCLNNDGVEITISISYQYKVQPSMLLEIIKQFRDYDTFKDILNYVGESAIHDSCSQFNTIQFQAERGAFQEDLRQRLVHKYDDIGTVVTDIQVNNVERPNEYESAIRIKERAREDIVVATNERPQALTEAETTQREAETQANIIISKANSDSRIINNQAAAEAEGIFNQYKEEAATYKRLVSPDGLGLTSEGLLSYVGIRMIQNAQSPVSAGIKAPAKLSYAP